MPIMDSGSKALNTTVLEYLSLFFNSKPLTPNLCASDGEKKTVWYPEVLSNFIKVFKGGPQVGFTGWGTLHQASAQTLTILLRSWSRLQSEAVLQTVRRRRMG